MSGKIQFELLLKNNDKLPTLPGIAIRILQAVQKEDPELKEICEILSTDPPLCAEILKMINSSYYGLPNKVTSLPNAVNLLGPHTVKNLALSFSLVKQNPSDKSIDFDYTGFWEKSLISAISAKLIMKSVEPALSEDAFFLGLLHDIGRLALNQCMPRQYLLVLTESDAHLFACHKAETRILGFNHMQVGSVLTRTWGLPDSFSAPIACHHEPEMLDADDKKTITLCRALHLATLFTSLITSPDKGIHLEKLQRKTAEFNWTDHIDADLICERIQRQTQEVFPLFKLNSGMSDEYEQIMGTARDELSRMNLALLRQKEEQSSQIEALEEKTTRDGMTQLINYQFFHEMLAQEISRSYRMEKPLSIVLCDIDRFKLINDTYGHLAGDEAIKRVAECLKESLRNTCYVARYGGEEFAVIMFEASVRTALMVAQTLRKAIESLSIQSEGYTFSLTMSFGVADMDEKEELSKEELIGRADSALYRAKNTGRNKCCVWSDNPKKFKAV